MPNIGFFKKIQSSDIFVYLDDAQFAKDRFDNRNKIRTDEGFRWITVPLKRPVYRKKLNEEQMDEYLILFEKYFLKSFTSRLTDYSDPKIDVLSAEVLNAKYTIVKSLLLATDKKPEVKIEWRVYTKNPDKPLIRDLIIEGLSLARTQKEEFASVIESNGGDVTKLFITLKEFVGK